MRGDARMDFHVLGSVEVVVGSGAVELASGKQVALLACLLMVNGIFKVVAALGYRIGAWGWPLASGVIDVILGVMIWQGWPASALWVIGLFVGISLLVRGLNRIGLGLALRVLPRPPEV